jgi:rRNA maturation endonuclease Nob1
MSDNNIVRCPACDRQFCLQQAGRTSIPPSYCPYCGSKMGEEYAAKLTLERITVFLGLSQ